MSNAKSIGNRVHSALAETMDARVSLDVFREFCEEHGDLGWPSLPEWIAPFWVKGRSISNDHQAFLDHLARNTPEVQAFLVKFVAWKLRR